MLMIHYHHFLLIGKFLDLNKSSELYRKLAHRIDELLFETLMEDNLTYDNDFNFKQLYKALQYDKENNTKALLYRGDDLITPILRRRNIK